MPVSTAQQTALNLKANLAGPTFTGTVSGISATMVGLGNVTNVAQEAVANKDTDGTLAANSDTKYPSQKAVKTYVDTRIAQYAEVNDMQPMGAPGASMGICDPANLPPGMIPFANNQFPTSPTFGNYIYLDGSIMVFIPKFYYKAGTGTNGLAVNAVDVKPASAYVSTAAANSAGYALHRAFIDGGTEKAGFFIDKYKVSKNAKGTGFVCSSIWNALPLSTAADHNPMSDLTASAGVNVYYKTIDCAHARDGVNGSVNAASIFHVASQFQRAALALLSLAHGQASSGTTWCAWYNASYNYPKGCNNNSLRDCDDATVLYTTDGYSNCGKTGSGVPFNKT
ncbi:MAG: hypothetical protein WCZ86_15190, partial [Desulfurivibrionaceae bacterium]